MKALECGDRDERGEGVDGFLGILVVVSFARQPHAYAVRDVSHTLLPYFLVETCVDAHVGCTHLFGSELFDDLDGARRLSLEPILARVRVQVDGEIPGDGLAITNLQTFRNKVMR